MNKKRYGAKAPMISTKLTCSDEAERLQIEAYLTRDGRTLAGSIMALIRSDMRTNAAIIRGETSIDLDVIRRAMTGGVPQ